MIAFLVSASSLGNKNNLIFFSLFSLFFSSSFNSEPSSYQPQDIPKNVTPKKMPKIVADVPIVTPTKKKILIIPS